MTLRLDANLPSSLVDGPRAAQAAWSLGHVAGWIPETASNPFAVSAAALATVPQLRVGSAVAVAFARSPFVTAQTAWELARLSRGGFTLGLGTQVKGHIQRRFAMDWTDPLPRLREHILAVRALWSAFASGEPPSFQGRHHRIDLLPPPFDPGPHTYGPPPILLAAVNPGVAELAGEVADGIVVHPLHSPAYLDGVLLPALQAGLATAGRRREDVHVLVPVWAVVGSSEQERAPVLAEVRRQIAFYGATRTYRRVFEAHGWAELPDRLHRALAEGPVEAAVPLLPEEALETFAVVGSAAGLAAQLDERLGSRADACMLYAPIPPRVAREELADVVRQMNPERGEP